MSFAAAKRWLTLRQPIFRRAFITTKKILQVFQAETPSVQFTAQMGWVRSTKFSNLCSIPGRVMSQTWETVLFASLVLDVDGEK